ncbi:MAG: hypothetical protein ACMXYG_02370 [Candidatus Woesearchaeota archaeon]
MRCKCGHKIISEDKFCPNCLRTKLPNIAIESIIEVMGGGFE